MADTSERMKTRRIVTGIGLDGKSMFLSAASTPRSSEYESAPGFVASLVWATSPAPQVGESGMADPTESVESYVPETGATRCLIVSFPPDSIMMSADFDPAAFGRESAQIIPGLADRFEPDSPGMHTTDTVDYGVVLDGEIWLELDNQQETKVERHQVVVQQGTRHAWRNKSDRCTTMMFVLIGATRRQPQR